MMPGMQVLPAGDLRGVERLQQACLAPLHHALRAGMGKVGLEAGADLLEGFVLVAEEGEGRRLAVLGDIARVEVGVFVAGPVEHDQVLVFGGAAIAAPKPTARPASAQVMPMRSRQCLSSLHPLLLICSCGLLGRTASREKCFGNSRGQIFASPRACAVSRVTSSVPIISRSHRPSSMALKRQRRRLAAHSHSRRRLSASAQRSMNIFW